MSDDGSGRVIGIGGVFFRSPDPEATRNWYGEHLGLGIETHGSNFRWRSHTDPEHTAFTLWSPFDDATDYFGDPEQQLMINYRVDDLDAILRRLRDAGVEIVGDMIVQSFGRFQHIIDGDGRRVELWEPIDTAYTRVVEGVTDS